MSKTCTVCHQKYAGFGAVCAPCRKKPGDTPSGASSARGVGSTDMCHACGKRVYVMEQKLIEGLVFHKDCFKCATCSRKLEGSFGKSELGFFCMTHFQQIAKLTGGYKSGTGPTRNAAAAGLVDALVNRESASAAVVTSSALNSSRRPSDVKGEAASSIVAEQAAAGAAAAAGIAAVGAAATARPSITESSRVTLPEAAAPEEAPAAAEQETSPSSVLGFVSALFGGGGGSAEVAAAEPAEEQPAQPSEPAAPTAEPADEAQDEEVALALEAATTALEEAAPPELAEEAVSSEIKAAFTEAAASGTLAGDLDEVQGGAGAHDDASDHAEETF